MMPTKRSLLEELELSESNYLALMLCMSTMILLLSL